MPPLFSIITPSFNSLTGLRRSFDSVQSQAPKLFEYLIMDGASTDGTVEWLQQQKAGSFQSFSERDSGVYDAINKGIHKARGQFLYILGTGDVLTPGILEHAAEFIDRLPFDRPRFIYGDVRVMNRNKSILGGPFTRNRLCETNICHQAIFYERSIFELLGTYDLRYPIYSDWAFNLRCFGDNRIARYYWMKNIADFEGNGLSDRVPDLFFEADRPALIRKHLGLFCVVQYRIKQKLRRLRNRLFGSVRS